ncbi:MAG: hypothetical protein ACN6OP_16020 [Pseudomonadales bacterium]
MAFFNMAIHGLADDEPEEYACFALFYFHRIRNIKAAAAQMDIGRQTFYDRMKRFGRRAHTLSTSIKRIHQQHVAAGAKVLMPAD